MDDVYVPSYASSRLEVCNLIPFDLAFLGYRRLPGLCHRCQLLGEVCDNGVSYNGISEYTQQSCTSPGVAMDRESQFEFWAWCSNGVRSFTQNTVIHCDRFEEADRYTIHCAWCGCTVGRTSVDGSHGICPPCSETWLDDWKRGQ